MLRALRVNFTAFKFRFPDHTAKMAEGVGGALKSFWALVNNWEHKKDSELRLKCENGYLLVNYSVDLGVWVPPTPAPSATLPETVTRAPETESAPVGSIAAREKL